MTREFSVESIVAHYRRAPAPLSGPCCAVLCGADPDERRHSVHGGPIERLRRRGRAHELPNPQLAHDEERPWPMFFQLHGGEGIEKPVVFRDEGPRECVDTGRPQALIEVQLIRQWRARPGLNVTADVSLNYLTASRYSTRREHGLEGIFIGGNNTEALLVAVCASEVRSAKQEHRV